MKYRVVWAKCPRTGTRIDTNLRLGTEGRIQGEGRMEVPRQECATRHDVPLQELVIGPEEEAAGGAADQF